MKQLLKRMSSILLSICMIVTMLSTVTFATEDAVDSGMPLGTSSITTYTISGTVSDVSSPLEGASVQLKNGSDNVGSAITTDNNGAYTITDVVPGTYTVEVSKTGFITGTISSFVVTNENVNNGDFTLSAPIYTVSGAVSDAKGNVVTDARIQLKNSEGNVGNHVATTGNGSYTILAIVPGDYTIEVSKSGYITDTISSFTVSNANITDKNITLSTDTSSSYTISGMVTDAKTSAPISGAFAGLKFSDGRPASNGRTGSDGRYTISGVKNGADYKIVFTKMGYTPGATETFTVSDANVTGKDIALTPTTYTISGTIVDKDRNGIKDVSLQLKNSGVNVGSPVTTDSNGAYIISGVAAGTYGIEVSKEGYTTGYMRGVTVDSANLSNINIQLVNIVDKVDVSSSITFDNYTTYYTGTAISHETATFTGTADGTVTFTYTYSVQSGTTGDLDTNDKPLGAGMYRVKVIYEDDTQRGEKIVSLTVNKATPIITGVSVMNSTVYLTSYVILKHTDSNEGKLTLDADQTLTEGTKDYNWTFTPTDMENYNNTTGTVSITVMEDTITNLVVTSPPTKTTYQHGDILDKTGLVLTGTLTSGSIVRVGYIDIDVTYQNGNLFSAGDTLVTLGYGGMTTTQEVTVDKADYTGTKTANTSAKYGKEVRYDLANLLIDNASIHTVIVATDADSIITGTAVKDGTAVKFTLANDVSKVGKTATLTINASESTNHKAYDIILNVSVTNKNSPTLTANNITVDYTGTAVGNERISGTAIFEGTTVGGTWAFKVTDPTQGLTNVADSGAKTVVFTPTNTNDFVGGEATLTLTINKATPTGTPSHTAITTSGNKLSDAALSIGSIMPAGAIVWDLPDTTEVKANESYAWAFTPNDIANYNNLTGSIKVWQKSTGGGSGSGGGGGSSGGDNTTVTTPPVTTQNPNPPTETVITVKPTVSDETLNATVSDKTLESAIDKAVNEAKKNGTQSNGVKVEIKLDTKNTTANNISVNLPKIKIDDLVKANVKEITISSEVVNISLNLETLKEMQKQIGVYVNVSAKKVENKTLSAAAKSIVGNRPVYDFAIKGTNGKKLTNFGKGKISVSIPYELDAKENPANIIAYYIDSTGKVQEMANSVYDPVAKTLSFVTDHFSKFAVGYKSENVKFTDTANHWAKDSIEFVAARGILSGTGNNKFSPNTSMTRGMFVTALGRLAEVNTKSYTKSNFTDVKADAYYMPYVGWSSKSGIIKGIGGGKFAPDQAITREQMAVIMANYAKAIGFPMPKVYTENIFADNAKIGSYAKTAVKEMQMAGILSGKNSNKFDPQGTATRAEVSAVLKRFVELVINTDNAEGWTVNDNGRWMYYKDGKPLTGKQTIDGVSYDFNSYGETSIAPSFNFGTHIVTKGESWWSIARKYKVNMFTLAMVNHKTIFTMFYVGNKLKIPTIK